MNKSSGLSQAQARSSITLTTTGSSGASTYNPSTGVLNIPNYAGTSSQVINDSPGRTLSTADTDTGFQVSATRNALVCYEGYFSTTTTIGGVSQAVVYLETANTNSTSPAAWTVIAQQAYANSLSNTATLTQQQAVGWSFCRTIPAGKYVRIRQAAITGTASVVLNNTQQEVLQ